MIQFAKERPLNEYYDDDIGSFTMNDFYEYWVCILPTRDCFIAERVDDIKIDYFTNYTSCQIYTSKLQSIETIIGKFINSVRL